MVGMMRRVPPDQDDDGQCDIGAVLIKIEIYVGLLGHVSPWIMRCDVM